MKGQKLSSTRQLNKHWQSGDSQMRDFNYIWLSSYAVILRDAGIDTYYDIRSRKILLLPRNNRIYFYMSDYSSYPDDVFVPYILSKDFKLQLAGKEFSTADLYDTYVNHPEKFHNVYMEENTVQMAGDTIPVYCIKFSDRDHEPSEYYIEYKWKDTRESNIHITYYLSGGDQDLNYQMVGQKTLDLEPFHGRNNIREVYTDCKTDYIHYLTTDYIKDRGYYYDGGKQYHIYSYFFLPEYTIEGGIRKIDINNLYTNSGGWNLGTIRTTNGVLNFFTSYRYRNNPELIYNGYWQIYSQFNYDYPVFSFQIHNGGLLGDNLHLCKYMQRSFGHLIYEDPSFYFDGEPIITSDFYYLDYFQGEGEPDIIELNWIQLQKWRVD